MVTAGLASVGCPAAPTPPPDGDADVIFPENYRTAFTLVRDCRNSVEHEAQIRVYVNAVGAADYLADAATLPEGTMVVKEEFAPGGGCDDADLEFWSAMRKEAAGFDEAASDWRFQEVSAPVRAITTDDNATCLECHFDPACLVRDLMCTAP